MKFAFVAALAGFGSALSVVIAYLLILYVFEEGEAFVLTMDSYVRLLGIL